MLQFITFILDIIIMKTLSRIDMKTVDGNMLAPIILYTGKNVYKLLFSSLTSQFADYEAD